jgi:adenylate cyclase
MVPRILKDPDIMKPGAIKKDLSILFSDIANFTAMSEGMDPDELARRMNGYFERAVTDCIQEAEGTVVKFIGDSIFAIWNAPIDKENHREFACLGAIKLRDGVCESFADLKTPRPVRTRIGLHSGEANVGNFGSSRRVDYTAFGENVNLASRMEGLNKYLGTDILVTGQVLDPVKDKFVARFLGRFILKGFAKAFDVHELLSTRDKEEESRILREVYERALKLFREKKFEEAEEAFKQVFNVKPEDGPTHYYLKQLKTLDPGAIPADWDGAIELTEK